MSENKLQKRVPSSLMEKGQYVIAFVVIGSMLLVAGFPTFVIFFFGVFAYFLWKIFTSASRNETREIFEFYLSANDILRDDERRWFGFEIHEVISRGERILHSMSSAPPLVYFTLGALYNKIGDHKGAVTNLSGLLENESLDEMSYVYPSSELRNYVKVLRKIEREPAEAPLTSAAVRSLERARKNRGRAILEESKRKMEETGRNLLEDKASNDASFAEMVGKERADAKIASVEPKLHEQDANLRQGSRKTVSFGRFVKNEKKAKEKSGADAFANRKPITEVLHDIYDKNVQ